MEACHMNYQTLRDGLAALAAARRAFHGARAWEQFHAPKNLAMSLAIEVAEVMEHFQWSAADPALATDQREAIALELADVMIYLLRLSTVLGVDLVDAVRAKLAINEERYPVAKARGRAEKYDEL